MNASNETIIHTDDVIQDGMRCVTYTLESGKILIWAGAEYEQPDSAQALYELEMLCSAQGKA